MKQYKIQECLKLFPPCTQCHIRKFYAIV